MINKLRSFLPLSFRRTFVRQRKFYEDFYRVLPNSPANKGHLLMYVGLGISFLTPLEILIYHTLRKAGWRVDYVIYDDSVILNEVVTKEIRKKFGRRFWRDSARMSRVLLKAAKVEFSTVPFNPELGAGIRNNYQTLHDVFNCVYNNVHVGDIVKGTMFRYYKSLTFGDDALEVAQEFLVTSISNLEHIRNLTSLNSYSYVLMSHGIYCTWQPVVEHCRNIELNYICDRSLF